MPAAAKYYYLGHCSGVGLGTEFSLCSCLPTSSETERHWAELKRAEMYVGSVRAQEWQEQVQGNPVRTDGEEDPLSWGEG